MIEVNELKAYGINATEEPSGDKEYLSIWFDKCVLHIRKDAVKFSPIWIIPDDEHFEENMKKFMNQGK